MALTAEADKARSTGAEAAPVRGTGFGEILAKENERARYRDPLDTRLYLKK